MDVIPYNKLLLFCLLLLSWQIDSIEDEEEEIGDEINAFQLNSWPTFYHLGESQTPTQDILNNLTYYRSEWRQ